MEAERFEQFSALISGIYRDMQKIKAKRADSLGMKSVHIFWVYLLKNHPEGLTASELSRYSQSNRSLVSREIQELMDLGYVTAAKSTKSRRYGQKLQLTPAGEKAANDISQISVDIQNQVSDGIPEEDLMVFYRTLSTIMTNFHKLTGTKQEESTWQ